MIQENKREIEKQLKEKEEKLKKDLEKHQQMLHIDLKTAKVVQKALGVLKNKGKNEGQEELMLILNRLHSAFK